MREVLGARDMHPGPLCGVTVLCKVSAKGRGYIAMKSRCIDALTWIPSLLLWSLFNGATPAMVVFQKQWTFQVSAGQCYRSRWFY